MLEDIKKIQGINHNDFDNIIETHIESCKSDLKNVGIAASKISETDPLIYSMIVTYVLSFLDVNNSEMYSNSYLMQKDALRHYGDYK